MSSLGCCLLQWQVFSLKNDLLRGIGIREMRGDEECENLCWHVLGAMQEAVDCYIDDLRERQADEGGLGFKIFYEMRRCAGDEEFAVCVVEDSLGLECFVECWCSAFQSEKNSDGCGHLLDGCRNSFEILKNGQWLWPIGCRLCGIFFFRKKVNRYVSFIGAICEGPATHMECLKEFCIGIHHGHGLATGIAKGSKSHVADCDVIHGDMVDGGKRVSGSEEMH